MSWVKPKPKKPARVLRVSREPVRWAYRFLIDLPEGLMLPGEKPFPPVRKGDLVSKNALPPGVWGVLLKRGAVEPVRLRPEWSGPNGGGRLE